MGLRLNVFRPPGSPARRGTRRRSPPDRGPGARASVQGAHARQADGLTAQPSSWYSWDFEIALDGRGLCTLDLAHFREEARFEFEGAHYLIRRTSRRGAFILMRDDQELARAVKPSMWRRRFELTVNGTPYELKPSSLFGRHYALRQGVHHVGSVSRTSLFKRRVVAELPQSFSALDQIFVLFLVIVLWRRDARASSG